MTITIQNGQGGDRDQRAGVHDRKSIKDNPAAFRILRRVPSDLPPSNNNMSMD